MSREAVMQALFTRLLTAGQWRTVGRRLQLWTNVPAQPALFLRHIRDEYPPRAAHLPAKVTVECEAWVYDNTAPKDAPADYNLNALLDALETAIAPAPGFDVQTLGGLVTHAWIEGPLDVHSGDLDGQAIAIVPIRMLVPTIV